MYYLYNNVTMDHPISEELIKRLDQTTFTDRFLLSPTR